MVVAVKRGTAHSRRKANMCKFMSSAAQVHKLQPNQSPRSILQTFALRPDRPMGEFMSYSDL